MIAPLALRYGLATRSPFLTLLALFALLAFLAGCSQPPVRAVNPESVIEVRRYAIDQALTDPQPLRGGRR